MTLERQASGWLAVVQDRAMARVLAEAVAESREFSSEELDLVEIGILAGAREMLDLLNEIGLRRRPRLGGVIS